RHPGVLLGGAGAQDRGRAARAAAEGRALLLGERSGALQCPGAGIPWKEQMIGERVTRKEDAVLLRGEGKYTDDLNEPGQAYAYVVRSQHAHGVLKAVRKEEALKKPGVLAVYTAEDLAAYGPHKCLLDFKQRDGSPMPRPVRKSLA